MKEKNFEKLNFGRSRSFLEEEEKKTCYKSRVILYLSQGILLMGLLVIMMDSANFFTYGKYIGSDIWTTYLIFILGVLGSLLAVPFLYWSSFKKLKKNDNFWDKETFWILPVFVAGIFFQYISSIEALYLTIPLSLLLTSTVHIIVMISTKNIIEQDSENGNKISFLQNMIYLSAYYLISFAGVITFDFFEILKEWIY